MHHPFIGDLKNMSDSEVDDKIKELTSKYLAAQRFNNPEVLTQLQSFLTIYREELKTRSLTRKMTTDDDDDLDQLINID